MSLLFNGTECKRIHFTGIFGSGMSAIAQYLRCQHLDISGSDRFLFSNDTKKIKESLESLGCLLLEQNGSGITSSVDLVCVSTAIENDNPDIAAAREWAIPVVHRSDLLAAIIKTRRTIAVAGTSGKSTVTAMIFELLTACGKSPSLISGAALKRLEQQGYIGNAFSGSSDLLVVEADESDGTLIKYEPFISIFLNISKDHKSILEVKNLFSQLASRSHITVCNSDDPVLADLTSTTQFGLSQNNGWYPDTVELLPSRVILKKNDRNYSIPIPGKHNASNCAAALCVCELLGCDKHVLSKAVDTYSGVARRFSMYNTQSGILIIDDFAHNPEKIRAAVQTAHGLARRVVAIYQPHGFGPTRFLKNEYCQTFHEIFTTNDTLILLPIYYAGGTAQKDISSDDLIKQLSDVPFTTFAPTDRTETAQLVKTIAQQGDCILVMGARDPSLPAFVESLCELFGGVK